MQHCKIIADEIHATPLAPQSAAVHPLQRQQGDKGNDSQQLDLIMDHDYTASWEVESPLQLFMQCNAMQVAQPMHDLPPTPLPPPSHSH